MRDAGRVLARGMMQLCAQHRVHRLRLLGRGGLAGADGPHGLVGDHDLADAYGHSRAMTAASWRFTTSSVLPASRCCQRLADADDRRDAVGQRGTRSSRPRPRRSRRGTGDAPSGRRWHSAPAKSLSIAADCSPVKAPCGLRGNVLRAQRHRLRTRRAAIAVARNTARARTARCRTRAHSPRALPQRRHQRLVGGQGCRSSSSCRRSVSAVGRHRARRCCHHVSTILPMCWFDSINACACAAPLSSPAAAKVLWITGLTAPLSSSGQHLLAQRLARPRP